MKLPLALLLILSNALLTSCGEKPHPNIAYGLEQCAHPAKPNLNAPDWDKRLARYDAQQNEVIEKCRNIISSK